MPLLKTALAIVLGFLAGSAVNMGLITLGSQVIVPPPGVDLNDMESLKAAMPLLGPKYFLFPFLAHALGTLVGALVAFLVAPRGKGWVSRVIGVMFLVGGLVAAFMIPAPKWFIVADLALAYLPMAWLGARIGAAFRKPAPSIP
jgi:hypothetical protein